MKLELKHLAAYLPYSLMVRAGNFNFQIIQIDASENIAYGQSFLDIDDGYYPYNFSAIKPILRPLSDLTKEITIDGESFVAINKIYGGLTDDQRRSKADDLRNRVAIMPHVIVTKLIKLHFDIFGLIDAGLAVDYNTLNGKK